MENESIADLRTRWAREFMAYGRRQAHEDAAKSSGGTGIIDLGAPTIYLDEVHILHHLSVAHDDDEVGGRNITVFVIAGGNAMEIMTLQDCVQNIWYPLDHYFNMPFIMTSQLFLRLYMPVLAANEYLKANYITSGFEDLPSVIAGSI